MGTMIGTMAHTRLFSSFLLIYLILLPCPSFGLAKTETQEENIVYPELNDIVLGSDNAPLKLVEYSSINCTHCAHFRHVALKKLKEKYINTGKIQLIYRHFPLDYPAVEYMSLVAKHPHEKWPALLEVAYERQGEWIGKPVEKLGEILGMNTQECKQAMGCEETKGLIMAKRFNAEKVVDIQATPTFHIFYTEKGVEKSLLINEGITPKDLLKKLDELLEKADRV